MKRILIFIIVGTVFFLSNSCEKDSTSSTSATPEELLTKSLWKMNEMRYSQVNTSGGGTTYYYKRGTTGNITNFDSESILFSADHTGTFTLGTTVAPFTWQFIDAAKTKIQWTITYSPGNTLTVNWENVMIAASTLSYGEYYTTSGDITSIGIATQVH